jgi:hypothetical protein
MAEFIDVFGTDILGTNMKLQALCLYIRGCRILGWIRSMPETTTAPDPGEIRLVRQRQGDDCGIATVAMIAGVSYHEAYGRLAPPPSEMGVVGAYHDRETAFLKEKDWWASAQLKFKDAANFERVCRIINKHERLTEIVENSQRVRLVLAFADGEKLNHAVVWDRKHKDEVFDPSRGVISILKLFNDAGRQSYSGVLEFTAFRYSPGQAIEPLCMTWTDDN